MKPGEGAEKTPLDVDVPENVHVCSSTNKYVNVLKIGLTVGFTQVALIALVYSNNNNNIYIYSFKFSSLSKIN